MRRGLTDVPGRRAGAGRQIPRRLLAGVAAVVLMGTAAYAVTPGPVTDTVGNDVHGIGSLFQGGDGDPDPRAPVSAPDESGSEVEDPAQGPSNESSGSDDEAAGAGSERD